MAWARGLLFLAFAASLHADAPDPAQLALIRQSLKSWLAESDLAAQFESAKLRWVQRPDQLGNEDARWLQWDLLAKTVGTKPDAENDRFLKFARAYRATLDQTLVERLFFRLLHESGERRADIAVYVFVMDHTYSISFDPQKREIVLREDPDRMVRRSVDLTGIGVADARRKGIVMLAQPPADAAAKVQAFLSGYFAGPPPTYVSPSLPEPDFAGVRVEGIRHRVLRNQNYWEKLEISIDLKGTPELSRAVCHISAGYAAGLGNRLPSSYHDMEDKYRTEIEEFTDAMLSAMKTKLSPGR